MKSQQYGCLNMVNMMANSAGMPVFIGEIPQGWTVAKDKGRISLFKE